MLRLVRRFHLTDNPRADILSGLTVALALVPEAIAFAFVAKVDPLVGLYAAFFVGFITSILGGRSGMISGATGAMAVAMVGLVTVYGAEYLFAAVFLTGLIQIGAGVFQLGKFIRLVPYPVMLGFVNGLAIVIFLAQLGQFKTPAVEGVEEAYTSEGSHSAIDVLFNGGWLKGNDMNLMLGLTLLTMLIIWAFPKVPKLGRLIPSSLVSILGVSFLVIGLDLDTKTVGDLASVAGGLPEFHIPMVPMTWETLYIILPVSVTLAAIGLIESLLTLTLIDEMTDTRGRTSQECVGQGLANTTCGLFGAMGGCAMIGQSMININSGGRGRLSGITAAVALLGFILFASCIGGCAGSASCGIKIFRFQILYAVAKTQIMQLIYPNGVFTVSYNKQPLSIQVAASVMAFFFIFVTALVIVTLALLLCGLDILTALSGAITTLSNVGPGLGDIIGPAGNFSSLPDSAKWIMILSMLLGRLEFFTLLVFFVPRFWRN